MNNAFRFSLYPLNSTGTGFENQSIDQAWGKLMGPDMVKVVQTSTD